MKRIKIGFCPTRRECFSREEAWKFRTLVAESLKCHDADTVDLKGINEESLLCSYEDVEKVIERFTAEKVDAVFFPHCNFGSEALVSRVARAMKLPVLLWGPRDDSPDGNGIRSRDSQCGLFATGKVLRRHNVPFTYLTNSKLDSEEFHKGFDRFLATARVVRDMKNLNILQISTRPEPFSSVMCNEGELLERFDIHVIPVTITDVKTEMENVRRNDPAAVVRETAAIRGMDTGFNEQAAETTAALKLAVKTLAERYNCRAAAIQCWSALQTETGIMPCLANALLTEEGLPVACETDICGAITEIMVRAAAGEGSVPFFADVTVRHPENDNAELLWHCGNFPPSLARDKTKVTFERNPYNTDRNYGIVQNELKPGNLTIARFDGDRGDYRLLIGEAKTTEGPMNKGSYVWIETNDWRKWEHKLVEGPYIHHVAGAYGSFAEILQEACKYIPYLTPDPVAPTPSDLSERWM